MQQHGWIWIHVLLSEISQTEKDNTVRYHLYVEPKKYNDLVNITKKQQIHRYREQTSGYHWGKGRGRGNIGVGDKEVQTVMYKVSYKDLEIIILSEVSQTEED